MEIEDRRVQKACNIHGIGICKCFYFNGDLYMKIPTASNRTALNFKTGMIGWFDDNEILEPVNAKVIIE